MVVIRLSRFGSKKNPFYSIVAADKRAPRDGRFIEKIGFYNPVARGESVSLHMLVDKYEKWVGHGASPSDRVASLYRLYLKNNSQDLKARLPKITKEPIENSQTTKPKKKEPDAPEATPVSDSGEETVATKDES